MAETDREFDDLAELLSRKQNNLALQARLREESKELDLVEILVTKYMKTG